MTPPQLSVGSSTADRIDRLIAKYGERVPRYTSYPTAPNFKPGVGAETYAAWLATLDASLPISAYIHIPFCRSLCWYCGCNMSVAHSNAPVADYVNWLIEEIRLVRLHVGARLGIAALHFGGGTPNALLPKDLVRLVMELRQSFDVRADAELAAEIDPRVLTADWVTAAVDVGLNRVSLGVQDTDPQVQQSVNRIQPFRQTAWAVEAFRKAGIGSINMDLMYGLPHQTTESVACTVAEVIDLAPDRIALFGYAHVPWMKPAQRLLPEQALPTPRERFEQQKIAAELLVEAGYVRVGLDHFAKSDDMLVSRPVNRNFQGYTTDDAQTLLGFGASAIGRLPRGYVQNAARTPDWRKRISDGELATVRGVVVDEEDTFRGEIISRLMCDLSVNIGDLVGYCEYAQVIDLDLERLRGLESDGLIERQGTSIRVTELGRPFVRSIASVFDVYLDHSIARHSSAV